MTFLEGHDCFPLSIEKDQKIWRYMDFTKFMSLLVDKALWFNRVDKFNDPFEGKLPLNELEHHRNEMGIDPAPYYDHLRKYTYANCWYISDTESAAMWKLYAKSEEAVAIQTTYEKLYKMMPDDEKLRQMIPDEPQWGIGEITYIDYKNDTFPKPFNGLYAHMHKRKAFEHEKELRALIREAHGGLMLKPGGTNVYIRDPNAKNDKHGVSVPVKPAELVESIYIAPMSPQWFKDLVVKTSLSHGFGEEVIFTSELDKSPY